MDERARYRMQQRLAEAIDEETALTLMAHLPPGGWTEVATRSDIERLEGRIDRLEGRIGDVEGRMGSYIRIHIATSVGAVVATAGAVLAAVNI